MRARLMNNGDKPEVLKMLGNDHGVEFGKDIVVVSENEARQICGLVAGRNAMFLHEFRLDAGALNRHVAEIMFNFAFALGQCRITNPNAPPEAMFTVNKQNEAMRHFVQRYGARKEHPGDLYSLVLS